MVQDVAAKIVCDNLQALVALTARADADLPANKRINHAYAHTALKPLMPILLLDGSRHLGPLPLRGAFAQLVKIIYRQQKLPI